MKHLIFLLLLVYYLVKKRSDFCGGVLRNGALTRDFVSELFPQQGEYILAFGSKAIEHG